MAATTGTAMLGLTIGCARCHDHKFDPIPVKDYYQFVSVFTSTIRSEVDIPLNSDTYVASLKKWQSSHQSLQEALTTYENLPDTTKAFQQWLKSKTPEKLATSDWNTLNVRSLVWLLGATPGSVQGVKTAGNAEGDTLTVSGALYFALDSGKKRKKTTNSQDRGS